MKMTILINGKKEELDEGTRISDLLKQRNIKPEMVTVELNNAVIRRGQYSGTLLRDQDQVELVYFMGGGETATDRI